MGDVLFDFVKVILLILQGPLFRGLLFLLGFQRRYIRVFFKVPAMEDLDRLVKQLAAVRGGQDIDEEAFESFGLFAGQFGDGIRNVAELCLQGVDIPV